MKAKSLVVVTGLFVFAALGSKGVHAAGKCNNIPIRVSLYSNVVDPITNAILTSAIYSDGSEYVDGTSGVTARINLCSGTNDATLNLFAKRTFTMNFPTPIPNSIIEEKPVWVPGVFFAVSGFVNVRNILYSRQPFTTHMGVGFSISGDRSSYRLRFMPFVVDAPDLHIDPNVLPSENTPYDSSYAKVYPQPFDCNSGGATKPSWLVIGNNVTGQGFTQVGTMHKLGNNNNNAQHEGQYMMPFELRIEALTCFTY